MCRATWLTKSFQSSMFAGRAAPFVQPHAHCGSQRLVSGKLVRFGDDAGMQIDLGIYLPAFGALIAILIAVFLYLLRR